jgi:hypothetical protein
MEDGAAADAVSSRSVVVDDEGSTESTNEEAEFEVPDEKEKSCLKRCRLRTPGTLNGKEI